MKRFLLSILPAVALMLSSCHQLDDDRIPFMPVNISLENQGLWNSYGVTAYGNYNIFILNDRIPKGFPYSYNSYTGYGGVLLICGQNPFTGDMGPMAYDLSCPVERMPDIRVYIDDETWDAICPVCGSHYNVVEGNGAPTEGPAQIQRYALRPYTCYPSVNGGYIIRD